MAIRSQTARARPAFVSWFSFVSFVTFVSFVPIALATCGGRKDPGLRSVRIAIGGQNQMVYLPATLAQELGFYREEGSHYHWRPAGSPSSS